MEIARKEARGVAISASRVRAALRDGHVDGLEDLVPEATAAFLRSDEARGVRERLRAEVEGTHDHREEGPGRHDPVERSDGVRRARRGARHRDRVDGAAAFEHLIRAKIEEVLRSHGVTAGRIRVSDRGALDYAIHARVETAPLRAAEE